MGVNHLDINNALVEDLSKIIYMKKSKLFGKNKDFCLTLTAATEIQNLFYAPRMFLFF